MSLTTVKESAALPLRVRVMDITSAPLNPEPDVSVDKVPHHLRVDTLIAYYVAGSDRIEFLLLLLAQSRRALPQSVYIYRRRMNGAPPTLLQEKLRRRQRQLVLWTLSVLQAVDACEPLTAY
jgi:hypothetical protein